MITTKRIYETYNPDDGFRILVDRLWPRGVSHAKAHLNLWLKDVAPSPELRTWFGHDPTKWTEFRARYISELKHNPSAVSKLLNEISVHSHITLLYAARDQNHSHAVILTQYLNSQLQNRF